MNGFAKTLYEKFFMRDLVGKIVPGAIIFLTAYTIIINSSDIIVFSFPKYLNLLVGVILFASFLILGLCVQMFGELLGLHSAHPRPLRILFFKTKLGKKSRELFDDRNEKIEQEKISDYAKDRRERFVVLKEGSGNTAVALFISFLVFITKFSFKTNWRFYIIILILSILCYWAHVVHRTRQAYYEIKVLKLKGHKDYDEESIEKYIGRKL
ncbi:MAG: hypothetical protein H8D22_11150 [Candidatus Cloacimonetes bacterium]|nr:hypothetical protein [Candidatus Cloacimonadota bacterium]